MTNWDGTPEVEHRNSRTSEITRAREKNRVSDTSFRVELRGFARSRVETFRCRTQLIENLTYHFAGCWDASGVGGVGGSAEGGGASGRDTWALRLAHGDVYYLPGQLNWSRAAPKLHGNASTSSVCVCVCEEQYQFVRKLYGSLDPAHRLNQLCQIFSRVSGI